LRAVGCCRWWLDGINGHLCISWTRCQPAQSVTFGPIIVARDEMFAAMEHVQQVTNALRRLPNGKVVEEPDLISWLGHRALSVDYLTIHLVH
jgi:hypothetical protein